MAREQHEAAKLPALEAEVNVRQMTDEQRNARLTRLLERWRETPLE